jgi:hypothetical protein
MASANQTFRLSENLSRTLGRRPRFYLSCRQASRKTESTTTLAIFGEVALPTSSRSASVSGTELRSSLRGRFLLGPDRRHILLLERCRALTTYDLPVCTIPGPGFARASAGARPGAYVSRQDAQPVAHSAQGQGPRRSRSRGVCSGSARSEGRGGGARIDRRLGRYRRGPHDKAALSRGGRRRCGGAGADRTGGSAGPRRCSEKHQQGHALDGRLRAVAPRTAGQGDGAGMRRPPSLPWPPR